MVNPGAFRGKRKEFLLSVKSSYAEAVKEGYAAEEIANIQRCYFKRFPLDLPHDQDPSDDHLAAVDDDAVDPDAPEPDPSKMTPELYAEALDALDKRQRLIDFRKAQIKRWLAYQYMKDNDVDPKETGANNPYRLLLCQLTGKDISRPRMKTACNVWRKTKRDVIEEKAKALALNSSVQRSGLAALRDKVAREMFNKLPEEEKKRWQEQAEEESKAIIAAWKQDMKNGASTLPEDRQRCIHGLVRFMQPILDMVCNATGWKATCILGGPEPADEGRLNMLSVHSGKTTGDIPLDFGQAERERYRKQIVPIFGSFLKKCYSPEECRARALNPEGGFMSMQSMELDHGATFHSLDVADSASSVNGSESGRSSSSGRRSMSSRGGEGPLPKDPDKASSTQAKEKAAGPAPTQSLAPALSNQNVPPDPNGAPNPSEPAPSSLSSSEPSQPRNTSPPPSSNADGAPGEDMNSRCPTPAAAPDVRPPSPPPQDVPPSPLRSPVRSPRRSSSRGSAGRLPGFLALREPSSPASTSSSSSLEVIPPPDPSHSLRRSIRRMRSGSRAPGPSEQGSQRPSKRRRTSADTVTSSSSSMLAESLTEPPLWFRAALEMLRGRGLQDDLQWGELLEKWALFEAQEGYRSETKLPSLGRPPEIGAWIQRARISRYQPPIADVDAYAEHFCKWWASLQPEWRRSSANTLDGDWDCLRKGGVNGILSAIVGLFFWGAVLKNRPKRPGSGAEEESKHHLEQWRNAVDDCVGALTKMITDI